MTTEERERWGRRLDGFLVPVPEKLRDGLHDDMDVAEFHIPAGVDAVAIFDGGMVHILTVAKLRSLLEAEIEGAERLPITKGDSANRNAGRVEVQGGS